MQTPLDSNPERAGAAPIIDLTHSPNVRLRPISVGAVRIEDDFWAPRIAANRTTTLPSQLRLCEETGRIDNFRRASGKKHVGFQGIFFNDSDVYKWVEAASLTLVAKPDPSLAADIDSVIAEIAAAQEPDGYLSTYFTFERSGERWSDLKDHHEIYCAGHLIQAAVAHHRATGKTTLLDVAIRLADCLDATFGPNPGKRPGACGHPEAEMALVELYRETRVRRYLHLAEFMIECRGLQPGLFDNSPYYQDHRPFRKQTEATGHAVRQLYLAAGAADVASESNPDGYMDALQALWDNFTSRRMYVTGGAGARYEGEAFGNDYELPNGRAYAETCAAVANVMWNWRMLNLTGEARYADVMERALYNAVLPGLSLDGSRYFYVNPLADEGHHRREAWFGTACCPPNVSRLLASLTGYVYSVSEAGIWAHLYAAGSARIPLPSGEVVDLTQETGYPWSGDISLHVDSAPETPFTLHLRVPGWARKAAWNVGRESGVAKPGAYLAIRRTWMAGDVVRLSLAMSVEKMVCNPYAADNAGKFALQRGPLVYCIEHVDHPGIDIRDLAVPAAAEFTPEHRADLLGGVTMLHGHGVVLEEPDPNGALYQPIDRVSHPVARAVAVTATPYYAWANREPGPMRIWIRKE